MNFICVCLWTFLAGAAAADGVPSQASHVAGVDANGHISLGARQPLGAAQAGGQVETPQQGRLLVRREGLAAGALQAAPGGAAPQQEAGEGGRAVVLEGSGLVQIDGRAPVLSESSASAERKVCVVNPPENKRRFSSALMGFRKQSRLKKTHLIDMSSKSGPMKVWQPEQNDKHPWVQMDLGGVESVMGVVTQGMLMDHRYKTKDGQRKHHVFTSTLTKFRVQHSRDGKRWTWIKGHFRHGSNPKTVRTMFKRGVAARYVKIHPTSWTKKNGLTMQCAVLTDCKPPKATSAARRRRTPPTTRVSCYDAKNQWWPLDMRGHKRTVAKTVQACQRRCSRVRGCAHFSWWTNGGCHLEDARARRGKAAHLRIFGYSGPPKCKAKCYTTKYHWEPINMRGQGRSVTSTPEGCQQRCSRVKGCAHFGWWQDGGCHVQDALAKKWTWHHNKLYRFGGPRKCSTPTRRRRRRGVCTRRTVNPPDTKRRYSSIWRRGRWGKEGYFSHQSQLDGPKAWTPKVNRVSEYMDIDLGGVKLVAGTVTQGRKNYDSWVTKYKVKYSVDRKRWAEVPQQFPANKDRHTKVTNIFDWPVRARFVRLIALAWVHDIAFRAGVVIGCPTKTKSSYPKKCTDYTLNVPERSRRYSSVYNRDRLSMLNSRLAWTPKTNQLGQWMTIDLGAHRLTSGIVTQGHPRIGWWTTAYRVAYQAVGKDWAPISGTFKGNRNRNGKVYVRFPKPVWAKALRISVEGKRGARPSMRAAALVCKAKEGPKERAWKARVRRAEKTRQRNERSRWKFDRRVSTPAERKRGDAFAAADHKLRRSRSRWKSLEAVRQRKERYRRRMEKQRKRWERWRQRVFKDTQRTDLGSYRKLVAMDRKANRADKLRNSAERARQASEKRRIGSAKERWRQVTGDWKRSGARAEKLRTAAEAKRWKSERWRRASAWRRTQKYVAEGTKLREELSKLLFDEIGRMSHEKGRSKAERYRDMDVKETAKKLMVDYRGTRRQERYRQKAEAVRRAHDAWRQRIAKGEILTFDQAMKLALRKDADLTRREKHKARVAKAIELLLLKIGNRVNSTERWRLVNEFKRLHQEMLRLKEAEDDENKLVDATVRATKDDEDRKASERNRVKAWKDLLARVNRAVGDATRLEGQASRAEGSREAEDVQRAKDSEAALKKLLAGEDQLTGDEAMFKKSDTSRERAEKRRARALEDAIGKLTNGEHWLKGLEVSRWKAEMRRQEKEQWRREQQEAHDKFLRTLTGNATHDAMLRRKYEAERERAEKERQKRLKALGLDADTKESAAHADEQARRQDEAGRLGAEARREREDEEEDRGIKSSLTRLERMELARRRAERVREENERKREDAEERRLQEIVKAALKPGPPGPPGRRGAPGDDTQGAPGDVGPPGTDAEPPWQRARVEAAANRPPVDCSKAPSDPYCGRRRRSSIATVTQGE